MTKEQKDILLTDFSARLPYKVKVQDTYYNELEPAPIWLLDLNSQAVRLFADEGYQSIEYIKPYLFPLSSMTDEQENEWDNLHLDPLGAILEGKFNGKEEHMQLLSKSMADPIQWCDKNHFDCRGLIPMGLAIDATGKNIY